MSVAFFDLDRTLIDVNSGRLWVRAERRAGLLGAGQVARASWWLLRYHLGWADLDAPLRAAVRALAGQREEDMEERVARFYAAEVRHRVRPEARAAVEAHRARGDRLALLTTSSVYLARHFARDLGLDAALASAFEVRGGRFTGEPAGELCFGVGKRHAAARYAEGLGVPLSACAFYTDAAADLPLLEVVGAPVAVCPDRLLAAEARRRGWPVARWGAAGGGAA
ncbi:MAG: HAD-IB family hydrolase [Deltaproteobacteria bacterium]|nr:HAD-IB family hydrolase [Deltaproteobacteria bacterium]